MQGHQDNECTALDDSVLLIDEWNLIQRLKSSQLQMNRIILLHWYHGLRPELSLVLFSPQRPRPTFHGFD